MEFFNVNPHTWDLLPITYEVAGIKKVLWVERFNSPGEFKISGDPVPLMTSLPLGFYLSHSLTDTIMVVENHFIDESEGESPKVVVSGRTLDACYMENRVVNVNREIFGGVPTDVWDDSGTYTFSEYPMQFETNGDAPWDIVKKLLNDHLVDTEAGVVENVPNLYISTYGLDGVYSETTGLTVTKKLSYLSDVVYKILKASDLGLKVCRPGPERLAIENEFINSGGTFEPNDPEDCLMFVVYRGDDISESVEFDINNGDLNRSRYLMTVRGQKNGFYAGNATRTVRHYDGDGTIGAFTKMGLVDATDYVPEPGMSDDDFNQVLYSRGYDLIRPNSGNDRKIVDVEVSQNASVKYQTDYKLGDVISVIANYGASRPMRVSEVATAHEGGTDEVIPTLAHIPNYVPPEPEVNVLLYSGLGAGKYHDYGTGEDGLTGIGSETIGLRSSYYKDGEYLTVYYDSGIETTGIYFSSNGIDGWGQRTSTLTYSVVSEVINGVWDGKIVGLSFVSPHVPGTEYPTSFSQDATISVVWTEDNGVTWEENDVVALINLMSGGSAVEQLILGSVMAGNSIVVYIAIRQGVLGDTEPFALVHSAGWNYFSLFEYPGEIVAFDSVHGLFYSSTGRTSENGVIWSADADFSADMVACLFIPPLGRFIAYLSDYTYSYSSGGGWTFGSVTSDAVIGIIDNALANYETGSKALIWSEEAGFAYWGNPDDNIAYVTEDGINWTTNGTADLAYGEAAGA